MSCFFRITGESSHKCGGVHQRILGISPIFQLSPRFGHRKFSNNMVFVLCQLFFVGVDVFTSILLCGKILYVQPLLELKDLVSRATCIIIQMIFSLASTDVFVEVKLGEYEIGGLARFYRGTEEKSWIFLDVLTILTVCL